jgi:uncharacterized protein YwqG
MPKKRSEAVVKRIRRPCVPDDFEEELTQEECDMIDKWFPQYEEEAEAEADEAAEVSERVICICGSIIMPKSMKSHEKTKKHLAFISETPEATIKIDSILI